MIIYILMMLYSLLFAYLAMKVKKKNNKFIFIILAVFPIFFVSAFRYDVGTDYLYRYANDYLDFSSGVDIVNIEFLFKILMKICLCFSNDYVILFIVTSFLIIFFLVLSIYKNSKNIFLSFAVFLLGGFFFQSLNLVRQYIAIAIIIFSYKYMFNNKKKWILSIIIATLFHSVSLIFVCAILLYKKEINIKEFIIAIAMVIILGNVVLNLFFNIVATSNYNNIQKYAAYFNKYGKINFSSLIPEILIYIYFYYISYKTKKIECTDICKFEKNLFLNLQTISILLVLMNRYSELFFRVKLLFTSFQILSIPYYYELNKRLIANKSKEGIKKIYSFAMIMIILGVLTTKTIYSNFIKGNEEILPYKTIFEVENREGII